MNVCLELANLAKGKVSPNPLVGSVIVKNKKIIGKGYHKKSGTAHAELDAINNSTEDLEGATLYCNLEPCCHTNKLTPPCTKIIIEKKIKRVVVGNLDPNPYVSGNGVKILRDNGIEVIINVLKVKCEKLNQIFFKHISLEIPYIHLKAAISLDGKITKNINTSTRISNDLSNIEVHELRNEYDSILIGINTAIIDNPSLTIRLRDEKINKIPYKIVLGFKKELFTLKLFKNNPEKLVIVSDKIDESSQKLLCTSKVLIINEVDLKIVLKEIYKLKICSILVEGGSKVFSSFLELDLFDKISTYTAPVFYPNGVNLISNKNLSKNLEIHEPNIKILGNNILTEGVNRVYRAG